MEKHACTLAYLACASLAACTMQPVDPSAGESAVSHQKGCQGQGDCSAGEICDTAITQECQVSCVGSSGDVAAYLDSLCPDGERCNPTNGFCRAANGGCTTDDDCALGQICTPDVNGVNACLQGCNQNVRCDGSQTCELALCSNVGQPPLLGPDPDAHPAAPTTYPILLAHGFNSSTVEWAFSGQVISALELDGQLVYQGDVAPFDTVEVRAAQLLVEVQNALANSGATKINLVCHSMGGLDCRYLASPGGLGRGDLIASITTIATPHQGTPVADIATGLLNAASFADPLLNELAALWGANFSDQSTQANVAGALRALSTDGAAAFNANTPDAPGVYYQSWAGVATLLGGVDDAIRGACQGNLINSSAAGRVEQMLLANVVIVGGGLSNSIPNDGLVTVGSAIYGSFQGCVPADHIEEVGAVQVSLTSTGPQVRVDPRTGWDAVRFYRNLAFGLADLGY
jgi:triacylglycerol lipase